MPAQKRFKTNYPGVYFIKGKGVSGSGHKIEKVFYITYRKDGKQISEKAGRQFQDNMTPAKASGMRARRIEGKEPTNEERRLEEEAKKQAEEGKWTIDRLWKEYKAGRKDNKALRTDKGRYETYLKPKFEKKEPKDIIPLDVDRLRIKLLKKKSPQTVLHILNLLSWITNFGVKKGLCSGLPFKIEKPEVHNITTEDLTDEQLEGLLKAIDQDSHPQAGPMMKLALFSGLRRTEMFKLEWSDIDYHRGFIYIRDPKGGPDQEIPLNDLSRDLLKNHPRIKKSEFVFPGKGGRQRTDINKAVNKIKSAAKLQKDFRPLHGLRHVFASSLASSGKVDLYILQKMLTHKDPRMTQRYSHLRDRALKDAANVAGDIMNEAITKSKQNKKNEDKVANLKDHKE